MTRPAEHALIKQLADALAEHGAAYLHHSTEYDAALQAARAYLAAPVVEPVAYLRHDGKHVVLADDLKNYPKPERFNQPLFTHPAPVVAKSTEPVAPPECKTEAEKTAFAFGWWKAMEAKQPVNQQLLERILETYDMGGAIFPSDLEELRAIVAAQGAKT